MTKIDDLLSAPLPEVEDAGFSRRVTAHVARRQQWQMAFEIFAFAAATAIFIALVPLDAFARAIETVTFNLGSSLAVAIAIAALVLSNFLARMENSRLG
jgi:hypothetical protein